MHFTETPDGRPWPLVERELLGARTVAVLRDCFDRAFRDAPDTPADRHALSFGELIRARGRALTDTAIRSVLEDGGGEKLRWLLGDDLAFLVENCSMRFHEPGNTDSYLGFHLDAGFTGLSHLMINLWVPLDRVGETCQSLTFLNPQADARPLIPKWREAFESAEDHFRPRVRPQYSLDELLALARDQGLEQPFFTPILNPGDAMLFNQFTVHATQPLRNPTATRQSYEFRVAAHGRIPSFYSNRQRPLQRWTWIDGTWTPRG